MRKKRQPDFWRSAWARWVSMLAADGQTPRDDFGHDWQWSGAMERARDGDWQWLDELVRSVVDDDDLIFAPSPALWAALDDFFGAPPDRSKGKKPRIEQSVAEAIRYYFASMTQQPQTIADEGGRTLRTEPPMTATRARDSLARDYHLSPDTIRDVVERRKTYRNDP